MSSAILKHRQDIDGLRFFAITPVVLYHALKDWFPSGFVGVDIFFAISGYLIGGIIYRESEAKTFTFANFYARRARRILPALLVVILATVIFGLTVLDTEEASLLAGSAQWAILGISNIFFYTHISYFAPDADLHPLLMTWSLGVEEQFYLIFPPLLIAIRALRRRFRLALLLALSAASFLTALYLSLHGSLAAFYLLPARAWEMGVGAALAMIHAEMPRERRWGSSSNPLAFIGLAMMVASFWLFGGRTNSASVTALVPVVGALLLIHTADSSLNRKFLAARPFVGVGLISYSWYLWHWPLMAFVQIASNGKATDGAMLAMVGLSLVLAYISWRFVEQPLRHRKLSSPQALMRYGATIAFVIVVLGLLKHDDMLRTRRLSVQVQQFERGHDLGRGQCLTHLGDTELPAGSYCRPKGATVAILGDSHASALGTGLHDYIEKNGSHLVQMTKSACPPLSGYSHKTYIAPNNLVECSTFQKSALNALLSDPSIHTVVVAGFLVGNEDKDFYAEEGGSYLPVSAEKAISDGTTRLVKKLHDGGKHVIVVQDVPKFDQSVYKFILTDAMSVRNAISKATSNNVNLTSNLTELRPMRTAVYKAVENIPDVTVIDLSTQFCTIGGCRYELDGAPLYFDDHHLSVLGSRQVNWGAISGLPASPGLASPGGRP